MSKAKIVGLSWLGLATLLLCSLPSAAQDAVNHAQAFGISARLSDLAMLPRPLLQYQPREINPVRRIPKRSFGQVVDLVEQTSVSAAPEANYTIGANILGVGNGFPNYFVPDAPPDTNMAVGDTQIVQWVNVSYTVCDKAAPNNCGPAIEGNQIWSGLPGSPLCKTQNSGDPIVQWDVKAHRWLLTQNAFAAPYAVCVAISTTADANGTYFLYQFPVPGNGFPDYPKWGIWTKDYGQAVNNYGNGQTFQGPQVCVYNRKKLLAGNPTAEQICHQYSNTEDSLLPADRDSAAAPPAGQDHFFIGSVGDVDNAHLSLYSVHINNPKDWSQGATFTGDNNSQLISITPFTPACNGAYNGACVPQKGVPDLLDSLGGRLMYRLAYWNDPTGKQHWLTNWDVTASGGQNGVRWMEFVAAQQKVKVTALKVKQEGTYAPNGKWRWMGSIARDKMGNILVGYSVSCGDNCPGGNAMFPSIFLAGRLASDPLGTLEAEIPVIKGTGSQPGTQSRWGDYSSMRVDQDGCTFWYTTEYYKVTQQFDWSTRIASAKFANCQ